jgi:hypothetical protein
VPSFEDGKKSNLAILGPETPEKPEMKPNPLLYVPDQDLAILESP